MTTSLSTEVHTSDVDRLTKPWWTCWAAMHWGFRRHACVFWCCHGEVPSRDARSILGSDIDYPVSVIIFYRELVKDLVPEHALAAQVVAMTPEPERKHLTRFYAGNNAFERGDGSTRPIHRLIDDVTVPAGMPKLRLTDDGIAGRVATSRLVDSGLRRTLSIRGGNPPEKRSETPLLLISSECSNLISTLPRMVFDPKNREDVLETGTKTDCIFSACFNAYRDYPSIVAGKPLDVLRLEAINRTDDPTQKFLDHMKFNDQFDAQNHRPRKR